MVQVQHDAAWFPPYPYTLRTCLQPSEHAVILFSAPLCLCRFIAFRPRRRHEGDAYWTKSVHVVVSTTATVANWALPARHERGRTRDSGCDMGDRFGRGRPFCRTRHACSNQTHRRHCGNGGDLDINCERQRWAPSDALLRATVRSMARKNKRLLLAQHTHWHFAHSGLLARITRYKTYTRTCVFVTCAAPPLSAPHCAFPTLPPCRGNKRRVALRATIAALPTSTPARRMVGG